MRPGKVECTCKLANHQHGTRTMYVVDKCRCDECREASRKVQAARTRAKLYGRYDSGRVDAAPVREHIQAMGEYGIDLKRLAKLAGVSNSTLGKVVYGDQTRNMPPRARVEKRVSDAVLAVRPRLEYLGRTVAVEGSGTRRRLQALVAIGWSQSRLAAHMGMTPGNFCRVITAESVQAATARRAKEIYDELWNQPQTGHEQRSRISASRARNYAKAHGWVPPMAWDDDTIDDPRAMAADGEVSQFIHAEERFDDVEFLLETGCGLDEVVRRSGYKSLRTLERACWRYGRGDLVSRVKNIASMERAA